MLGDAFGRPNVQKMEKMAPSKWKKTWNLQNFNGEGRFFFLNPN